MSTFTIENVSSGAVLLDSYEDEYQSAKAAILALCAQVGEEPEWDDDVVITEKWVDVNGDVNSRKMTVAEALEAAR